MPKLQK